MNLLFNIDPLETDVTITANGAAISLWVKNPKNDDARAYVFRRTETQECVFVAASSSFDKLCDIEAKINAESVHLDSPVAQHWREKCGEATSGKHVLDVQINSLRFQLKQVNDIAHQRQAELETLNRCHSEQFNTIQALQQRLIERAKRTTELEDMNKNAVAMHAMAVQQRDESNNRIATMRATVDTLQVHHSELQHKVIARDKALNDLIDVIAVQKANRDKDAAALQAVITEQKDTILALRQKLTLAAASVGAAHKELAALP